MVGQCEAEWDAYDAAFRETQADGKVVSEGLCKAFHALNDCLGGDQAHRFVEVCREFEAGQLGYSVAVQP